MDKVDTVKDLIEYAASRFSDAVAVRHGSASVTFSELNERINRLCRSLHDRLGLRKGDRVVIFVPNQPEYFYAYFALLKLGAVAAPMNLALSSEESLAIVQDIDPCALIVARVALDKVRFILDRVKSIRRVILVEPGVDERGCDLAALMAEASTENPTVDLGGEDIASCHYSSGTTGRPKGILLSHGNFVSNVKSLQATRNWELGQHVFGCPLPLFHGYSTTILTLFPLSIGATVVLLPPFTPEGCLAGIANHRVTFFGGVPAMYALFNKVKNPERFDVSCCRFWICGGAPLPVSVLEEFEAKFRATVCEGYGLIETSPVVTLNPLDSRRKPGTIGVAVKDVVVKIVDEEDREVPVGETGEVIITGPNIMQGYFRDPQRTSEVLKNGWFYTGDIGKVDEDGFYTIAGRKKELIIVSGENVYPPEIDEVLLQHDGVADAAAVGVADPIRGERVKAFIVRKSDGAVTKEEILRLCREKLAAYKVPKEVEFCDLIPRNATGKILRWKLAQGA